MTTMRVLCPTVMTLSPSILKSVLEIKEILTLNRYLCVLGNKPTALTFLYVKELILAIIDGVR